MPRIPVRTTPYHTLPRCTRHYKSKRDLILRALGKASFINGSQFVIAWISPKGEVDVYASELLQASVSPKEGGVLSRKELEREAARVKGEMGRRWDEIRRLEESGEVPTMEEDVEESNDAEEGPEEDEDEDPDRTFVNDSSPPKSSDLKKIASTGMMTTFPATRATTPTPPMHTITLAPHAMDEYYAARFSALQQATCKLVVKAWIKVIEPKKQMKFPYNKGEDLKPMWWPEGVRHREPDHLSKTERLTLLNAIVRSPLITVARLELSTAEAAAFISRPRQAILREVYLVAKEEEKRRKEGDTISDVVVHLPNMPVSPSEVSPEGPEKRVHSSAFDLADKENVFGAHPSSAKRSKHGAPRLPALSITTNGNYSDGYAQPFTYSTSGWRDPSQPNSAPAHMYSHDPYANSDYARSPNPEEGRYHPNHLAPILNHHHSHSSAHSAHSGSHSPLDSPAYPHSAAMSTTSSAPNSAGYFPSRGGYLQQQQLEYMQQQQGHGHYDYGSPYLADTQWEGFQTAA